MILLAFALSGAVTLWRTTEGLIGFKLLRVIIVDQILYFVMYVRRSSRTESRNSLIRGHSVILCSIANILANVTHFNSTITLLLNAPATPSLVCVAGSHLLIHLKEAGETAWNEGTSPDRQKISAINFAEDHATSGNIVRGEMNE